MAINKDHLAIEKLKEKFPLGSMVYYENQNDSLCRFLPIIGKVTDHDHNELKINVILSKNFRGVKEECVPVYRGVDFNDCLVSLLQEEPKVVKRDANIYRANKKRKSSSHMNECEKLIEELEEKINVILQEEKTRLLEVNQTLETAVEKLETMKAENKYLKAEKLVLEGFNEYLEHENKGLKVRNAFLDEENRTLSQENKALKANPIKMEEPQRKLLKKAIESKKPKS